MPRLSKLFDFVIFTFILGGILTLGSCAPVRTVLMQADLTPASFAPAKLDNPDASFAALERAVYGPFTEPTQFDLKTSEVVTTNWLDGLATVERREYLVSHGQTPQLIEFVIVTPTNSPDAPLLLTQHFSPNRSVIAVDKDSPLQGKQRSLGPLGGIFTYFFGRHIVEPPFEDILNRGYGLVAFHPPEYVADNSKRGTAQLNAIFGDRPDRPGALTIWSSLTTELAKHLRAEKPDRPLITYGHSRYGKTALLAAHYSPHIDGAISHQSGTAGASLIRDKTGESLKDVVKTYPQWLTPSAKNYADNPRSLPTDAHALLAVLAPKPILLGNSRRDVWSDPEGAFQAAKWASQNTGQTFTATRLDDFKPADDIAFWTRPGTHGIVKEDWPAFLLFLDAHFK